MIEFATARWSCGLSMVLDDITLLPENYLFREGLDMYGFTTITTPDNSF
jgi:hypothetical protein